MHQMIPVSMVFIPGCGYYDDISVDSGLFYCNKGIAIADKLDLQLNKAEMFCIYGLAIIGKQEIIRKRLKY